MNSLAHIVSLSPAVTLGGAFSRTCGPPPLPVLQRSLCSSVASASLFQLDSFHDPLSHLRAKPNKKRCLDLHFLQPLPRFSSLLYKQVSRWMCTDLRFLFPRHSLQGPLQPHPHSVCQDLQCLRDHSTLLLPDR